MDQEGWPIGRSTEVGPTWRWNQWLELKEKAESEQQEAPVTLDVPGRPDSEIAFTINRRHIPSKHVDPALLAALRMLRKHEDDGDGNPVTPAHVLFKKFDLHQMADALRRASPAMHTHLIRVLHANYGQRRLQLQQDINRSDVGLTETQKNVRSGVDDKRAREIIDLRHRQAICIEMIKDHNTHDHTKFECPVYLGHIRAGWTKHEARVALKERVYAGLHNLYNQHDRGETLLCHREDEYINKSTQPVLNVEDMEWSDEDADLECEDDIPQPKSWKPSRAWTARHYEMAEKDGVWDTEEHRAQANRLAAAKEGGRFNEMDGRYHNSHNQHDRTLLERHLKITKGRRTCSYYTAKSWCKHGFDCTLRHIEQSDETYKNFSSSINPKREGKGKNKGKGKGKKYGFNRDQPKHRRRE